MNLLTVALVMLSAIQVLRDIRWNGHQILLAAALAILSAVEMWIAGRMMYWAALTTSVMSPNVTAGAVTGASLGDLHTEACKWVEDKGRSPVTRFAAKFRTLTFSLWGPVIALIVGLVIFAVLCYFLS